jgi:putative membrane protein
LNEKERFGTAIYYAFGMSSGLLYGAAAELVPNIRTGSGSIFGAIYWLFIDEGLVPALGLSKSSTHIEFSVHIYALASHLVYGITTEVDAAVSQKKNLMGFPSCH